MCRMIAIVSRDKNFAPWLRGFEDLALAGRVKPGLPKGHLDGWGVVSFEEEKAAYYGRSSKGLADEIENFRKAATLAKSNGSNILIAHIRKASEGEVNLCNSHPFVKDEWAFCHNGTVHEHKEIPLSNLMPKGSTDSERFFYYILERVKGASKGGIIERLISAISYIKENFNRSSLTFLLSNGELLFAFRDFNEDYDVEPKEALKEYYTLKWLSMPDGLIFSSEEIPLGQPGWTDMENGQLAVVDKDGGRLFNEKLT